MRMRIEWSAVTSSSNQKLLVILGCCLSSAILLAWCCVGCVCGLLACAAACGLPSLWQWAVLRSYWCADCKTVATASYAVLVGTTGVPLLHCYGWCCAF